MAKVGRIELSLSMLSLALAGSGAGSPFTPMAHPGEEASGPVAGPGNMGEWLNRGYYSGLIGACELFS